MSFSPLMNLDGMRVVSTLDIGSLTCQELQHEPIQLAVILYPVERFNEKFLIKLRECVTKLPEEHPLKRWMKEMGKMPTVSAEDQKKSEFLLEVINSRFNLITDLGTKNRIVNVLNELPDLTLNEKLLRSFLYLMIGNVTKSDNILRDIIRLEPVKNWKGFRTKNSFYHRLVKDHLPGIWERLLKHPSDRKTFALLQQYLLQYMNDPQLLATLQSMESDALAKRLDFQNTERIAPTLVKVLRLWRMDMVQRLGLLRNNYLSADEQIFWVWPFMDMAPLVSESILGSLQKLEKENELWFIYLMENEKISDVYSKKSQKSPLLGKRQHLRTLLKDADLFMLSLYQLILLGDVDSTIIQETLKFLTHE